MSRQWLGKIAVRRILKIEDGENNDENRKTAILIHVTVLRIIQLMSV